MKKIIWIILFLLISISIESKDLHILLKENGSVKLLKFEKDKLTNIIDLTKHIGKENYFNLAISPDSKIVAITGHISKTSKYYTIKLINIETNNLIKEIQPGFGGRVKWFNNNNFFYIWGCGTNCVNYYLYDIEGKKMDIANQASTPYISFNSKFIIFDNYFDFEVTDDTFKEIKKLKTDFHYPIWCLNRNVLAVVDESKVYLYDAEHNLEGKMDLSKDFLDNKNKYFFYGKYLIGMDENYSILCYDLNNRTPYKITTNKNETIGANLITNEKVIVDLNNMVLYKIPLPIVNNFSLINYYHQDNYDSNKQKYIYQTLFYIDKANKSIYYLDLKTMNLVKLYSSKYELTDLEIK